MNKVENAQQTRSGERPPIRAQQIILTIRRKATVTTTLFALVFSGLAVAQLLFVRHQLYSAAWAEAAGEAAKIAGEIVDTNGRLDMQAVRNAFFPAREWYIVGSSGSIIDLEGNSPGIVGRVALPTEAIFSGPQTHVSEFGDTWRLFGKRLEGGTLIVGVNEPSDLASPDSKLLTNAARFGATLQQALRVNQKKIDSVVDYALVDQGGALLEAGGSLPLRSDPNFLMGLLSKREVTLEGKPYLLAAHTAYDSAHKPLATVVVPREVAAERKALRSQWHFNAAVAGASWLAVVSIMLVCFVREEIRRQRMHPSLTEARKRGEGQYIEFKRSLLWNREDGHEDKNLPPKVLKTIVAFLNSGGGALFIGVQDDGQPWGLADDLKRCDGSEDKFHQRLRNLLANSIGGDFCRYIMTQIDDDPDHAGYRVCCVAVERACRAAFMKAGSHSFFYIRSGPETLELDMEKAIRFMRGARLPI